MAYRQGQVGWTEITSRGETINISHQSVSLVIDRVSIIINYDLQHAICLITYKSQQASSEMQTATT